MHQVEYMFTSHILRYVGVGLVSGSLVHAGTLGGGYAKYLVLIFLGIVAFTVGTIMESKKQYNKNVIFFIGISVFVSIGTGMVSGGTQHYLDNPLFAAGIIPLGLYIGYSAFVLRDFREKFSLKRIAFSLFGALLLWGILYQLSHELPVLKKHHSSQENIH